MLYSELISNVLSRSFPEGTPRNLRDVYKKRILDGLIEAQRWVPYLRQRQYTLYPYASTLYRQGTTVIKNPRGKVKRLQTFNSKTLKDVVFYDPCTREDIDRQISSRARNQLYPNAVPSEFGSFYADATLDKKFRSERGLFCVDKDCVVVLPHIESCERIMIEWCGSKTIFADSDVVDYGKYQEQVLAALENWLRWKSVGKDDRSSSDYMLLQKEWVDSIAGLQIDTKDDTEPELPMSDLGELPRTHMPTPVLPWSLGCAYDATDAFFSNLWMLCVQNNTYYSLGALLIDNQVVEKVDGDGSTATKAEATYETIRAALVNLQGNDGNFYNLVPHIVDGVPVHGFDGGIIDATNKVVCDNTSCINLDILCPDDQNYYRLTLILQDGGPVLSIALAPVESESPVPTPSTCSSLNEIVLKDSTTQQCVHVRIKDGQIVISSQ